MISRLRISFVVTVIACAAPMTVLAQAPSLPPNPVPANGPVYGGAPAPLQPPSPVTLGTPLPPAQVIQGAPPPPSPYYPPPPLFAPPDPGRDGWAPFGFPSVLPTLFFDLDLYFLQPSIKGTLKGEMPLPGGGTKTFTTPGTDLDFAISPRFEVGWRLPDSTGEFSLSYRFLATDGTGDVASPLGTLSAKSRLNMNVFDFDYATSRYCFLPRWFVQWRLGARLETVYFDNKASIGVFSESASSYFVGAGPHAGVEVDREIALVPGLALFAKLDGAVAIGQVRQKFGETISFPGGPFVSNFDQNRTQSSPNLTVQAGLHYVPPGMPYLMFLGGFQYERFWEVGKVGGSTGDVQDYGGFFGAKLDF